MSPETQPATRFALMPLSVGLIIAATAVPVELRWPGMSLLDLRVEPADVLANLVLYLPLGIAIRRLGSSQALLRAAILSIVIESCQLFFVGRYGSPVDVIVNALGALMGSAAGRAAAERFGWRLDTIVIPQLSATVILAVAISAVLILRLSNERTMSVDFSNWDKTFDLAIGDELTGNRVWDGRLLELAVLSTPVQPTFIEYLVGQGPGSIEANMDLLPERPLFRLGRTREFAALQGTPLLLGDQDTKFFEALTERGTLSLLVWCNISDLNQTGPARLLTYSKDAYNRNFTLGQEKRAVHFRLRTPTSGPNGTEPEIQTGPILTRNEDILLACTYDGYISRVYANGVLVGRANLAAEQCFIPALCDTGLPMFTAIVAAFAAVGGLALIRARTRSVCWIAGGLCGALIAIAAILSGMGSALPAFVVWIVPLGLAAGLTAAGSAFSGRRRS